MTDYKAAPEQWAALEEQSAPEYDSTILELRARVEALGALIHELQTMHNTAVDWRMEQDCRLNWLEATMPKVLEPLTEVRECMPAPVTHDPVEAACAAVAEQPSTTPAPAGSRVERVAIACAKPCNVTWDDQARAAIREMAATLRAQYFEHAASWLEQEAER